MKDSFLLPPLAERREGLMGDVKIVMRGVCLCNA